VLAALLAVLCGLSAVAPRAAPTVPVVVAAHDLPGGTTLTTSDVAVWQVAADMLPARAVTDPAKIVGRTLVAPLTRGSPLTEVSTLSAAFPHAEAGSAVLAVPLSDATLVRLLSVGDRVDVMATSSDPTGTAKAQLLVNDALLLTVPADDGGALGTSADPVVLLAVPDGTVAALAAAAAAGPLVLVLRDG